MKIGILGTRGIPNTYGGFEQFAQYLSVSLVKKGHQVWVYSSHLHPYQQEQWNGVYLIHCKDPENRVGTAGQFIYDYNCFTDARKRNFDVLLQLGYTSSSIWFYRWPGTVNIVNMDGLEWKRSKYNKLTKQFLRLAEKLATKHADVLVADSLGIRDYLMKQYGKNSIYIPYGAEASPIVSQDLLQNFQLSPFEYCLAVARMEPENNIETLIKGYLDSSQKFPLVIVGNTSNAFGKKLAGIYSNGNTRFIGPVYDQKQLNTLRHFSALYFHGHSVGGTNPSLLEAMGCECLIAAHNNVFNKTILGEDALYFSSAGEITGILESEISEPEKQKWRKQNLEKIRIQFNWTKIVDQYEELFFTATRSQSS